MARAPRPKLNPVTVELARKFAESRDLTVDLLLCVGWDGDRKALTMKLMDLSAHQVVRVEKYAAAVHASATHGLKMPTCPKYVKAALGGWHP